MSIKNTVFGPGQAAALVRALPGTPRLWVQQGAQKHQPASASVNAATDSCFLSLSLPLPPSSRSKINQPIKIFLKNIMFENAG